MKITFIGGGNMAAALISGIVRQAGSGANIHVVDRNPEALERLSQQYGVRTATAIDEQVKESEVVVLAIKPQQMREVAAELAPLLNRQLVLSIAAGIRSSDLSRWLNGYDAIVRTIAS